VFFFVSPPVHHLEDQPTRQKKKKKRTFGGIGGLPSPAISGAASISDRRAKRGEHRGQSDWRNQKESGTFAQNTENLS
jgi:hypothetical protein